MMQGDTKMRGVVAKRAWGHDGRPIRQMNENPQLSTAEYEVEWEDGSINQYVANVVAENIIAQCDSEGKRHSLLSDIIEHHTNKFAALAKTAGTAKGSKTTWGWDLLVKWKDGSTSWVPLKDLKESNPIELAKYAMANHLQDEAAFAW